jgi:hypothetical protein
MAKVNYLTQFVNMRPKISIRGGRIVQIGYMTDTELQIGLAFKAASLGISVDELHVALTWIVCHAVHAGMWPGCLDDVVMAVHREAKAPYRFRDL